tara:strand:+ start:318 stop:434 length:117 start_codon:yes stop_codon:yes gene_type:complete
METYCKSERFVEQKTKKRGHGFTKALCKKAKLKRRNKR